MRSHFEIVSLEEFGENEFMKFLDQEKILHIFTIYDLRRFRERTRVWIYLKQNKIEGYIFVFNELYTHTHGTAESIKGLLSRVSTSEPIFVIEQGHFAEIRKFYEPIEPTDKTSKGRITTYAVLKLEQADFSSSIRHEVKKMEIGHLNDVLVCLGEEWRTHLEDAVNRGLAYGAYVNKILASFATVPEMIDEIALIRGVYTMPEFRNMGVATSACSALVQELFEKEKTPILWVAEDNLPARKIYEKLGFRPAKHILLGFKAKKLGHRA